MPIDDGTSRRISADLTEALVRFGLVAAMVFLSLRVLAPFTNLVLLGLILAVALYPAHRALARRLGGKPRLAAAVLVASGLLLFGVPTVLLGGSLAEQAQRAYAAIQAGSFSLPSPDPAVADWPLVGERLHGAWSQAAEDLPTYLHDNRTQIRALALQSLAMAGNAVVSVGLLLGSLIVAGIMMAYGESGSAAIGRILSRVSDPERGPRVQRLATAVIRSVASGVVGVAFIQSLLLGVGFLLTGVPAPGLLALIVMFVGIVQLPAVLISLPVIAYLWWGGDGSAVANVVLTAYLLLAGMSDNVLKPLLLGRGVDAPMLIILLGALGGMFTSGIIGLFVGPVVLGVSYEVFMEWVDGRAAKPVAPTVAHPGAAQAAPTAET